MTEEVSTPNAYPAMNPVETWIKALTQPRDQAYLSIVNDPGASLGKAVLWLAGFGFVGGLFSGIVNAIFGGSAMRQVGQMFSQYSDLPFNFPARGGGFMSVVSSSFGGLFGAVIGALIFVGLVQLVSRALGGTGTFEKLFYGYAAYAAPMLLITGVVGSIPFVNWCLSPLLGIYGIVLGVMANKAAHGYDTGKAVIAVLAPGLVIFLLCCCVIAVFGTALSALLGPSVNNVFGNIQGSLVP